MGALAYAHRPGGLLVDTGTNVAHCPSPFARYGHTLEDFGRYRRAGVNLGIGTDVAPHNVIEEMRLAAILARVAARDITTTSVGALFHAATVGGAEALGATGPRPAGGGGEGGPRAGGPGQSVDAAGARSAALAGVHRRGSRGADGVRARNEGDGGTGGC